MTAELSFDGRSDLTSADAEILLTLKQGDILWQKERLLNLAIKALPDHCEAVAWIDRDVLFDSDAWAEKALKLLDQYFLLHAFNQIYDVPPGNDADLAKIRSGQTPTYSAIQNWIEGEIDKEDMGGADVTKMKKRTRTTKTGQAIGTGGIGWVARREFIEFKPLYDACVVGGGDGALTQAIFGIPEVQVAMKHMNPEFARHYLSWAQDLQAGLKDNFGVVPSEAFHLWHGDLVNRRYWQRHVDFAQFNFDPLSDLALAADGSWKWSSDKLDMHRWVREFFLSRKEDG